MYSTAGDTKLKLDVFMASASESSSPSAVVLLIHGGGWTTGSKRDEMRLGKRLSKLGITAVALNYRLAPLHPWPAQLEDCCAALQWIADNAARLYIDVSRLGVWGIPLVATSQRWLGFVAVLAQGVSLQEVPRGTSAVLGQTTSSSNV